MPRLHDLVPRIIEMTDDTLRATIERWRSDRAAYAAAQPAKRARTKRSPQTSMQKLEKMLEKMSPEQRKALLGGSNG